MQYNPFLLEAKINLYAIRYAARENNTDTGYSRLSLIKFFSIFSRVHVCASTNTINKDEYIFNHYFVHNKNVQFILAEMQ